MPDESTVSSTEAGMAMPDWQREHLRLLESFLERVILDDAVPERLREAMAYSVLAAGKRIRAQLVYAAGAALGAPITLLSPTAAALECVHAYSLIHDDLPAMDDDDLRRGKASNHKAFDEATAILAGDALATFAFELISGPEYPFAPQQRCKIIHQLAVSAGRSGMVGGQMLDIQATGHAVDLNHLQSIHAAKTGALIKAAVLCGAFCAETDEHTLGVETVAALDAYATKVGLAFQIMDDVLDETADTQTLGKQAGADRALNKSTYPQLLGLTESRRLAQKLLQEALESIQAISDNTVPLEYLARLVVARTH